MKVNVHYDNIWLNYSQNKKYFSQNCSRIQNTFHVQKHFSEYYTSYEIMWKNMVEPDRLQIINNTTQERCDLHAG
jgi:hypothetical protein